MKSATSRKRVASIKEPSAQSLREIPEVDLSRGRANPYTARIAVEGVELQIGARRPAAGKEVGPTVTRTVRLPPAVWRAVERVARRQGLSVHAALRVAIAEWVQRAIGPSNQDSSSNEEHVEPRRRRRRVA
jgi:hypothetical protein